MEFACEKSILFHKWCAATKAVDYNSLKEFILLEEFKSCLPERVVVYFNEQKVASLSYAAVLADEFVLTHKSVFSPVRTESVPSTLLPSSQPLFTRGKSNPKQTKVDCECFYCHKVGHVIADCLVLKRKQKQIPKGAGCVNANVNSVGPLQTKGIVDCSFRPFLMKGIISLTGNPEAQKEIQILRDTGTAQSFVISDVLPFCDQSYCGANVLVQGTRLTSGGAAEFSHL